MVELVRSSDLVHLSWVQAMLTAEGIPFLLADAHISSIEGGIGAFPRRVLVLDEDRQRALLLLEAAAAAGADAQPD
ncbi:MAG: DUF2007 domain-containing protein [Geminicoccaceae bacterium]